jgi:branched-chain amino acid transport system ATP-binding protein
MTMMLEIKDVYVGYYKDLNILQGVNIQARKAQITTILGSNGVGKSTMLKAIFGYIKPTAGEIRVEGESILPIPSYKMVDHGIAYIPQHQSVFPNMTVEENIELGGWSFRSDRPRMRRKLDANYERFTILKRRRRSMAGELSGGMQRMVEIARSLMASPKLMLVDEPTAGLAKMMTKDVYQLLVQLKEEGLTILLVDQNIRQAIKIADYVYVLELGRNRHEGPREQFEDLKKALWL